MSRPPRAAVDSALGAQQTSSPTGKGVQHSQTVTLHRLKPVFAIGAFASVVLLSAYRTTRLLIVAGQPGAPGWGLVDFRDAVYYPVVSFLEGNNPYASASYMATYPVGNQFPLYLPVTLLLHLPFGLLPFKVAEVVYFLTTVALMPVLAYLTLRSCRRDATLAAVFGLAFLILFSAPGQWNIFLGQCTAPVVVGTYAALYYARRRPWLSAISVAVASFKPTSGVPLGLLMLARGDVAPVLGGAALSAGLSAAITGVLVRNSGGLTPFLASLAESYHSFGADPIVDPATSPYRVDVAGFVGRLLGRSLGTTVEITIFIFVLGLTAWAWPSPK